MAALTKQNALPLLSVLTALGTAFSLWFGVFDSGAKSGTVYEKISTIERSLSSLSDTLKTEVSNGTQLKIDVRLLQDQMLNVKKQLEELDRDVRDLQRSEPR